MMESNNCHDADQSVLSLCDEFWQWRLNESPELATFCGFHQYNDLWDDISEEAYIKRENKIKAFLSQAESLDTSNCNDHVGFSYKLLVDSLKAYLNSVPFKSYLMPLNMMEGIHIDAAICIADMKYESDEDIQMLISRLEKLPARVSQVIDVLKLGVEAGIVNYSCSMEGIPAQLDLIINADLDTHDLLKPLLGVFPDISSYALSKYRTQAKDIIMSSVFPAFQGLKEYLVKEYIPNVRPHLGIITLKKGIEWYQHCLNFHLTCSPTPQEVHALGMKEVARIGMQIVELARKEGLPENLPGLLQAIIKKQENTFTSSDEIEAFVQDLCSKRIRPKLTQYFKNLPEGDMKIEPTPDHLISHFEGFYRRGSFGGPRDGKFYVNTSSPSTCLPFVLPSLSLHEGEPGHHLQWMYSLPLPDFRRNSVDMKYYLAPQSISFHSAYVQGWGLYCEGLGEEMGLYEDSFELLGRHSRDILRAARLVVDSGLHAFGWSKEKAIKYLTNYTMEDSKAIEYEVDRFITWPGQAGCYKFGEIKIWELRRKAEKELGSSFDIKEFHHCILSCGAVTLHALGEIVDKFIQSNKPAKPSPTEVSLTEESVTKGSLTEEAITKESITEETVTEESITEGSITEGSWK